MRPGQDHHTTAIPTFQGFLVYIIDTQKNAPVGYSKALLERPEGDATDQGRNVCGAEKREHSLQRGEVEVKATKERQSLSVENGYTFVALKGFQEPMTMH